MKIGNFFKIHFPSNLLFKIGSLNGLELRLAYQRASRDLLVSTSPLTVDAMTAIPLCLAFYVGSGGPKSGSHTREVSMLPC